MLTPYNFSVYDTTTWVLDTESLINICNSLQELQVNKKFRKDKQFLNIGDESLVLVLALKTMQFVFKSNSVMLDECHYCPSFMMNIISAGLLGTFDFKFLIKNNFYDIIMNDTKIICG